MKIKKTNPRLEGRASGRLARAIGSPKKRTRDRAGKKEVLILAALRLFASQGYEATTTRAIAASAGCAEGLIHRYFKGKAGLLAAIIEQQVLNDPDLATQVPPAGNLEDEFVQMVEREVEFMWESRDFLRVFIPRAIVDSSVASVMNKALISVHSKATLERLKNHECSTALPQDAIEALAQSVGALGLVFGFVRPALLGQDRLRAKKMAVAVAKLLMGSSANSLVA